MQGLLTSIDQNSKIPASRAGEETAFQQLQQEPQVPVATRNNVLWKPSGENGGGAVMLLPYAAGQVVVKDAKTGQVIDQGVSTGASNGYADTVRLGKPGFSYRDIVVEDSTGKSYYVANGGQRDENLQAGGSPFG